MAKIYHQILLFVALFFVIFSLVVGTDHIVGDDAGWNLGVDYSAWTVGKTFFVGDSLVFKYKKGQHNVFDVNVTAFAECVAPTNQPPMESGNDVVRLLRPGTRWFLCSVAKHCESEQKLIIFVDTPPTNITEPALPPITLPVPFPPSSPVPTPPPTTATAPSPSVPSPAPNKPHLPLAPTPTQSIPPSYLPVIVPTPSVTAPPPSRASSNSAISVGVLALAVGVLAGIMT